MTIEVAGPKPVLLDANVLAPRWLNDTMLWLAFTGRLFTPVWSEQILAETRRTMIDRFGISPAATDRRLNQM